MTASSGAAGSSSARSRSRTWPASMIAQSARRRRAGCRADQKARHLLDRLLRRRQPDARELADRTSASSRSSVSARCAPRLLPAMAWISSTITVRVLASICRPDSRDQQDVQRLGRGHQDMRRPRAASRRARAAACRRCAPRCGSRRSGRAERRAAARGCPRAAPRDCVGCRWRAPSAARHRRPWSRRQSPVRHALAHQGIDHRKKRGERLARAGGRGDEHVTLRGDGRPGGLLGRGGRGKLRSNQLATAGWKAGSIAN